MAGLAFLYNLWNAKVGDLILWASPIIILYVIFKLWIYKESIKRKLYEKKTDEKIIVRIMWSHSKLFHRSYCVEAVGQESNWYVIKDIQKAISEGYTPCQKCRPLQTIQE